MENSRRPEVSFFILILLFGSAVIFVAPSAYALPPPNSTSTSISCSFYTQVSPNYFGCAVTLDDTTCGCTAPNGWIALSASGSGTFVVFDPPPDHVGTNCFDYGSQCGFTYTPAPGSASSQTITATYAGCIYTTSSTDCSYPGFTGSSSSIVVTATANTALAVSVGAPDAAVVGTPATFIAEASGGMPPFSSFTWTAPGGNPSTGTGSIFSTTFNAENTYTITAAVNDSAGGSATGFSSIAAVLSITGEVRCSIGILGDGLCLPIGTVQSQRGTSTVVDGTTGAQRSGTGMYLGDIIQTGDNSVVGLCPSSASCTPSLLRFDQDQDTTIGGLAAFVG